MKIRLPWKGGEKLADWVPWLLPLNENLETILTNSGGLLRCARIEAPDFESESPYSLAAHHRGITDALARYGNGWSILMDQWRVEAPGYLPASDMGGNHAAQLIEDSRRQQFNSLTQPVFRNSAFIAIHYLPQARDAFLSWLMDREESDVQAHISFFEEHTNALLEQLRHSFHSIEVLRGDELASYLSASVTYEPQRRMMPTGILAPEMASRTWYPLEHPLRIENRYVATVEVRNFGSPSPVTCEFLHELPFPCRWATTMHGLSVNARRSEIDEVRKRWRTKQRGIGAIITEIVTKNPFAGRTNPEVDQALASLEVMQRDLNYRPFAKAHANVHVWADSPEVALERAGSVASLIKAQGLDAAVATLNNVFAPLADMPGNVLEEARNVRRDNIEISRITRVAPVTGVSSGSREDRRFGGPALLAGLTRRGVPFFWSMNAPGSDLPHTELVGKSGGGKSTMIGLMASSFLRYPGARVLVFDRRRSFMVPCLCMGGDWIEVGKGEPAVQPLREIHERSEFIWAHGWIIGALRQQGLVITPSVNAAVDDAMKSVVEHEKDERTLTKLYGYMAAHHEARTALQAYLRGGPYDEMFDGVVTSYGEATVVGVETVAMKDAPEATPLIMTALFHAMQRDRLAGMDPKLVVIDEAWSLLNSDLFKAEIEAWARENRKLKAALVLATQSTSDLADEGAQVILGQMANHIYTPNPEALEPVQRALYEKRGLSEDQIRTVARMTPKRDYLLKTEQATRLMEVRLEDNALAICGASSVEDHERAWDILAQGIKPGEEFTRAWLAEPTAAWLARQRTLMLHAAE